MIVLFNCISFSLREMLRRSWRAAPVIAVFMGCLLHQTSGLAQAAAPAPANPATSQGAATPTLSANAKVVTLPVTVRDKKGQIVRNLTKDDFDLQDDHQPQSILYLTQQTDLPLSLCLLVDTSVSQRNFLELERPASKSFLDQMVTNKDRGCVIHFDRDVELLQDLTADHGRLESALQLLQTVVSQQQLPGRDDPDRTSRSADAQLYDSIFLASDELMSKQTGRKAVVILSDGVDRGSKESLGSAIEAAQQSNTIVYAIYFVEKEHEHNGFGRSSDGDGGYPGGGYPGGGYPGGRYPGGGYPGGGYPGGGYPGGYPSGGGQRPSKIPHIDGRKMLAQISAETGGRLYEVSKKDTVEQIYGNIAEELRTQYTLGYTPVKSGAEGFHSITLTVKKKDLTVQTKSGYYPGSPAK